MPVAQSKSGLYIEGCRDFGGGFTDLAMVADGQPSAQPPKTKRTV